jgi:hypothetical protein
MYSYACAYHDPQVYVIAMHMHIHMDIYLCSMRGSNGSRLDSELRLDDISLFIM